MRSLPRRASLAALAIPVALFAMAGCTAHSSISTSENVWTDDELVSAWMESNEAPLAWSTCIDELLEQIPEDGPSVRCGMLSVPLDWSDPDASETRELPVIRAFRGEEKSDIIAVNPGGPGETATTVAVQLALTPSTAELLEAYDLVGIDPRGVSTPLGGDPLGCDASAVDTDDDAAVAECLTDSPLVTRATTAMAALDHEVLRQALRQDQLNYLGYSYGTYLGGIYATMFPTHVGRMLLDGVADTESFLTDEGQIEGLRHTASRMMDACVAGEFGACAFTGSGEEAIEQLTALRDSLDASPLAATDSSGAATEVTGAKLETFLATQSYGPRASWAGTISTLNGVVARNPEALAAVAESSDSEVPDEWSAAVICAVPGAREAGSEPIAPGLYESIAPEKPFGELCRSWPKPTRIDPVERYTGKNTIVIVSALHDPATPHANAQRLHSAFENSRLVSVDADGHGTVFGQSQCASAIATDFFVSGALPDDEYECARE